MARTFNGYDIFLSVDATSVVMVNEESESDYTLDEFIEMFCFAREDRHHVEVLAVIFFDFRNRGGHAFDSCSHLIVGIV